MTAEIAIINRHAVALAADSAVTLGSGGADDRGQKILNSANKIWELSKVHPVGIMVYGRADFLDVPWEIVVKEYRKKLGSRHFPTLREYATDFLDFLTSSDGLFPSELRKRNLLAFVASFYEIVLKDIRDAVGDELKGTGESGLGKGKIQSTISRIVADHQERCKNGQPSLYFSEERLENLKKSLKTDLKKLISQFFENLPIVKSAMDALIEIGCRIAIFFPQGLSTSRGGGLVFAGYGEDEYYPVVHGFLIESVMGTSFVKVMEDPNIAKEPVSAAIFPFAQQEMVHTFMEGVDADYQKIIAQCLVDLVEGYPDVVLSHLRTVTAKDKRKAKEAVTAKGQKVLERVLADLDEQRRNRFVNPILSVVEALQKDELATMAETLVNLTSFKRRISMEAETVGGPTDVAVISKGDGFIWIKRKHYFQKDLNPQFFSRNYREDR